MTGPVALASAGVLLENCVGLVVSSRAVSEHFTRFGQLRAFSQLRFGGAVLV